MESYKETEPEAPTIELKDVSKTYEAMIQYLHGIHRCDGVPLSYVSRPTSDLMPIVEAENPINTYATYDNKLVKRVPIIEPGHAANATEEDGPFSDTFIGDRGKVWDLIYAFLHVMDALQHMKGTRRNCDGRKAMLTVYDHFLGLNNMDHL